MSLTPVLHGLLFAFPTSDITTPTKFAMAFETFLDLMRVVPASTAQQFTAVHFLGGLVTQPANCARDAFFFVILAVIWLGFLRKYHIRNVWSPIRFHGPDN